MGATRVVCAETIPEKMAQMGENLHVEREYRENYWRRLFGPQPVTVRTSELERRPSDGRLWSTPLNVYNQRFAVLTANAFTPFSRNDCANYTSRIKVGPQTA